MLHFENFNLNKIENSRKINLFKISFLVFNIFVLSCNCFEEDAIFDDEDILKQALLPENTTSGITVPGTKWCGPGDNARNYNDLGTQIETDKCCRAHDNCPEIINHKQKLHDLENSDWFPRLKCECEQEFLNCLQKVNNLISKTLGKTYFAARSQCFKFEYPAVNCTKYMEGKIYKRCVKYKFDNTKPKIWQWFDIPYFTAP